MRRNGQSCVSEKRTLIVIAGVPRSAVASSREDPVDAGKQFDGWFFLAIENASQHRAPFLAAAAFLLGEHGGGLAEAAAHRELFRSPAQPGFEIRAVRFLRRHGGTLAGVGGGVKTYFLLPPRFAGPLGYLTGPDFTGAGGPPSLSCLIWSRRCAARSNSSRPAASRISSSSSAMTRSLS